MADIRVGHYELQDFIGATKKVIRQPLFNRIDFADIYTEALELAKTRKLREPKAKALTEGPGVPMPADMKAKLSEIGNFGKEVGGK